MWFEILVAQALEMGELETISGLNQELNLKRHGETRWGSHYKLYKVSLTCFLQLLMYL